MFAHRPVSRRHVAPWLYLVMAIAIVLALVPSFVSRVYAASFTVTKTADTADGSCDANDCSLREAVIAANDSPGTDTIVLPAGTYLLNSTSSGDENSTYEGDLDISDATIRGAGAANTIIDAQGTDRIFDAWDNLTIIGVTLRGGAAKYNEELRGGGAVYANGGTLTIQRSVITNNTATYGDAIAIRSTRVGDGLLYISDSMIRDNDTGGIGISGGEAFINTTNVIDNGGGGIGVGLGTLHLTDSTVRGNSGTGIGSSYADMYIERSTISGNHADDLGGGIYSFGRVLVLTNSTVSGNSSNGDAGGIYLKDTQTTITNSTITENRADANGDGYGYAAGILLEPKFRPNKRHTRYRPTLTEVRW